MKRLTLLTLLACLTLLAVCTAAEAQFDMGNPWVETDHEGFIQGLGLDMDIPEGAENVIYRMLPETGLGEIQFDLYGMHFNARIKGTPFFEDISGLFYRWDQIDLCEIKNRQGVTLRAKDGDETVDLCTWCDIVPGVTYAVSVKAPDLDGFDITAVADAIFRPLQGEAG